MTQQIWEGLLDELEQQVPLFVQTFTYELKERALYDAELVGEDDLETAAHETMHMLIEILRGKESGLVSFATALGKRRAQQGVPLERLTEAIRLDLRIVWQMLLQLAQPDRVPALVQHVEQLMTAVDEYIDDVQNAFLAEVAILQRDSRLATEQHLSKLFNATTLSPALQQEVAQGIGIEAAAEFEVFLFNPQSPHSEPPRQVQPWLTTGGVFAYVYRGWLLLFRELTASLSTWPRDFKELPSIYIHQVKGLGGVASAARAAVELGSYVAELEHLTDIEDLWAVGSEEYLNALVPGYFRAILAQVAELPTGERDRVIQTVKEFLRSGSTKATAAAMHCHRNTVVNRLRQFQDLTGLDVTLPIKGALAVVLLSRHTSQ